MTNTATYITDHLDTWSSAIKAKSSAGRGSGKKQEFYGVKKLRELILELAVRGLLVPQDPTDEPASELLKRIKAEKAKLIKEGKIPKEKTLSPISTDEIPFEQPPGWAFTRIGDLVSKLGSGSTPRGGERAYVENGIIFLRSQNIRNEGLELSDTAYISEETHKVMLNTQVQPRDVLLNITGASLGRSTIFPKELGTANVSQHVTIIRLVETKMCEFVHLGILSPLVQKLVWGRQVGMAIGGLSKKVLEQFEFPIPPLAEQHRIVAKVDELTALCDQLEQKQEDSVQTHSTLVQTLLGALTTSSDYAHFQQAWQRIASHFDTLFSTESSIDQLKQTILQLGVMGKLVEQDPTDEPASELLKKINSEKVRMAKAGLIKRQKPFEPVIRADEPYPLPKSWQWFRLGATGIGATGKTPKTGDASCFGGEIEFIGPGQITPTGQLLKSEKMLTEDGIKDSTEGISGDILMVCIGGSIGKSVVANRRIAFNQQINSIRPIHIGSDYLNTAVSTNRFYKSVLEASTGSATPIINRSKWEELLVPIPPAAEQQRIIGKVDELMILCDRLKANLQSAQTTQLQLADTFVEQAVM